MTLTPQKATFNRYLCASVGWCCRSAASRHNIWSDLRPDYSQLMVHWPPLQHLKLLDHLMNIWQTLQHRVNIIVLQTLNYVTISKIDRAFADHTHRRHIQFLKTTVQTRLTSFYPQLKYTIAINFLI